MIEIFIFINAIVAELGYDNEVDLKILKNDWMLQLLSNPIQDSFQDHIKEIDILIDKKKNKDNEKDYKIEGEKIELTGEMIAKRITEWISEYIEEKFEIENSLIVMNESPFYIPFYNQEG